MSSAIKKAKQPTDLEYRLFESNDVAKYGFFYASGGALKPVAQKALLYLIWKSNFEHPGELKSVTVSLTELCGAIGYERGADSNFCRKLNNVKKNLMELMSNPILVYDKEKKEETSFIWLKKVRIHHDTWTVEAEFDDDLSKYFGSSLKRDFTVVRLKYLNRLNSSSAIILYAYCCSVKNLYCSYINVKDLIKLVTNKKTAEYKRFKSDILLPAIDAINTLTDIHVEIEEQKENRAVKNIIFKVYVDAADDEKELFMEYNQLRFDEATAFPYDEKWMNEYVYSMAKQEYVRKSHITVPCGQGI